MNPYLEAPQLWSELHSRLIVAIADALNPQILPKYRAAVERRIYEISPGESVLVGIPDVSVTQGISRPSQDEISNNIGTLTPQPTVVTLPMPEEVRESYLEIREIETGLVVTVIELLSPKNKKAGPGRIAYETKRQQVLRSLAHLVEIDLLCTGTPMPMLGQSAPSRYRILISLAHQRPRANLYSLSLQTPIPIFKVPLRRGESEPTLDLQRLIHEVYDRAGFAFVIDYNRMLSPRLTQADQTWLTQHLQSQGLINSCD
jgi:hypothetical protein